MLPDVVQLGKRTHRAEERQQNHGGDAVKDQLAAREKKGRADGDGGGAGSTDE